MKPNRLAAILCTLSVAASAAACCGMFNPASRLYGKWKLDVDETVRRASENNPLAGVAGGLANAAGVEMTIDFDSDGTVTIETKSLFGNASETGDWSVKEADGDKLTVEIHSNQTNNTEQMTVRMIDADTFETDKAGEQASQGVFRRVEE